ncbi:uncharacterized protein LOC125883072 isoform X1 [Epinephelus fuscoguttatus]|uniref:uncharacterized protein LOC125883072 isoform X1 n=1 Tax=Epinephelus fuscoguttatus TaxID=293821 RepID=UPI0020D16355|nr:uncharacterized protein LOC125883072 isoform X1 [Epinephelus fuscoguttatus]
MEPLARWTNDETQALISVWSEEKIQRGLEESFRNEKVYREVSGRLAAMGMIRSGKQCREKIKKLKQEYNRIKQQVETDGANTQTFKWYDQMETAMSEKPAMTHITQLGNSDMETDASLGHWSNKEVQALLRLWANPTVQEELLLNTRNNEIYAGISAKLASLGFNKEPKQCREKIKKLKQEYKRIQTGEYKIGSHSSHKSVWFAIIDEVLSPKAAAARRSGTTEASFTEPSLLSPSPSALDVDADDEPQWFPDEVQVLMTLWAQPNIQKQLLTSATSNQVFMYLSSELALVGFNKTPQQCSLKVDKLKEEYRRMKKAEPCGEVRNDWFAILDSVLGPRGETFTEVDSSAVLTKAKSPEHQPTNDMSPAIWTSDEIKVLVTRWAKESTQKQLRSAHRNERVFAELSAELATYGFDKTSRQCRTKIKTLKHQYRLVKEQKDLKKQKSRWFIILDKVLSREAEAEDVDSAPTFVQTSQQDLPETEEDSGCRLSLSSLCLLVPALRLICAFAWQVVQCCNVPHYGKVEELVRLVTELAPELLTPKEKVQLLLRLRARMVLELCRSESTAHLLNVQPHLEVIQNLAMVSTCDQQELEELENSKSNFVDVVHILLEDTEEREMFFKEVFPIHYGQEYEATLHTLVWKFISRVDNLLPVPDIKQTAEWLSTAPSVMEECGQLALEPEQLKVLLHFHQQQSGGADKRHSQTQEMFLPRLSLPHKPKLLQLTSEQQEVSLGDVDEEEFDYGEDEEAVEENQTGDKPTLEDYSEGGEDLKFKEEQEDDRTAAECSNLNSHMPLRLHTCSLCLYSDSHVSGLLQHIRQAHQEPNRLQSKEPTTANEMRSTTNTCEYCGKVFKDVSTLNSHRKTHTLPFQCDKCGKKYYSKASLDVHRRIHTGETPYLCSHCGRGFRSSYSLGWHVRIHTGDRRYKCQICGKTSIQHLARHMRMHRGEKNYLCTECGKAFLSSGELRLHMRLHTGERPYTCKHCGNGFIAKCLLTVHMRKHTGETPYKCLLCPKSFQTLYAQKKHMRIHSNKKSFQCLKCGKIFRQEETFKMHAETHN